MNTFGGVYMTALASVNNDDKILKKAAPGTPYTITALIIPNAFPGNFVQTGILFRESGTGRIAYNLLVYNGQWTVTSGKLTNPTTFSANYTSFNLGGYPRPIWLQISDTGVNRVCRYSWDGVNFFAYHTIARADFLTADEVGFSVDAVSATWGLNAWFIHWSQT